MDFKLGKIQYGFTSTATSAGTLNLVNTSKQIQVFTGTSTHTMKLPDATTLNANGGISFTVINQSTGAITVQDNGSNTIATIPGGASTDFIVTNVSTANGVWRVGAFAATGGGGVGYKGILAKSANYTIVSGDKGYVINVDTSAGAYTMTLPAPALGFVITIKDIVGNSAVNKITVAPNSSEKIDTLANDLIAENFAAVSYISDGTNWFKVSNFSSQGGAVSGGSGRGLFGGGYNGSSSTNNIYYVTISTLANAQSFGTLNTARFYNAGLASSTRGVFGAGFSNDNSIEYVTIATLGNATSFGTLTQGRYAPMTAANNTRGIFAGGWVGGAQSTIDYITIATAGNATSFGSLTQARQHGAGVASPVRAVFGGGYTGVNVNTIDYVTIATTGNATSFGTLTGARYACSGASNATRGLFVGSDPSTGNAQSSEYITIATTGNGTLFGTLAANSNYGAACSSPNRVVIGGQYGAGNANSITYINLLALSNDATFGSLTAGRESLGACSDNHGGL